MLSDGWSLVKRGFGGTILAASERASPIAQCEQGTEGQVLNYRFLSIAAAVAIALLAVEYESANNRQSLSESIYGRFAGVTSKE
jgi:hypothetical protein